ncbi:LOW QUALITY PROTEIN: endothelial cell-specific molecule 1 [Myotis yumanensis]|uniref:LOW QUALITY PROTEIN: endothelial cell-specific molecule 1 n=1 Tax=Myotis yumanensis TaxID=159337 RepID=UPI0038D20ED8
MTSARAFQFLDGSGELTRLHPGFPNRKDSLAGTQRPLLEGTCRRLGATSAPKPARGHGLRSAQLPRAPARTPPGGGGGAQPPGSMPACLLLLATLLVPVPLVPAPLVPAPPAGSSRYAVDCPQRCDAPCASGRRCPRTVLDDCGCCRVCAAERGHTCYRTVVGMDGAKCGPGLRCQFYSEEDAFGDEYGICKDCPFGTFGMDCRETCRCPLGVCDRVTGRCLQHPFLQQAAARSPDRGAPRAEPDAGSGDSNAMTQDLRSQHAARSPGTKWLEPR